MSSYKLIKQRLAECQAAHIQLSIQQTEESKQGAKKKKNKACEQCDPTAICEVGNCLPRKTLNLPDLPCDCSLF